MAASNEAKTKPFIIGIAGGTGAGKTTFAKSIYVGFGGTGWGGSGTKTTTNNGVLPGIAAEEDGFGSIAYHRLSLPRPLLQGSDAPFDGRPGKDKF